MIRQEEVIRIGHFAKPHGIKGEITFIVDRDVFEEADEACYIVCDMEGILVPFFVEDFRYKTDTTMLLKLEGVDSEAAARAFVNRPVYYPLAKLDGEVWQEGMSWEGLMGFRVIDKVAGALGEITDVDDSTENVLLQVDHAGRELLVPAVDAFVVDVDMTRKELHMSLPEGLLDL